MPRLLLVDDNPSIHRIAESLLAPTDVELVCVDSAAEALDRIARGDRFDVALVDTAMPGMDGWTLLARLRANEATAMMPIALMAGVLDPVDPSKLAKAPIQGFLKKPIELRELGDRVRVLLATPVAPPEPSPFATVPAVKASELARVAEPSLPEFRPEPQIQPAAAPEPAAPAIVDDLLKLTAEDLWPEEEDVLATAPVMAMSVAAVQAVGIPDVHLELEELDLESLQDLTVEPLPPVAAEAQAPSEPTFSEEPLVTLADLDDFELPPDRPAAVAPAAPQPEGPQAGGPLSQDLLATVASSLASIPVVPAVPHVPPAELSAPIIPVIPMAGPVAATGQLPAAGGQVAASFSPETSSQAQAVVQAILADPVLVDALIKAVVARMGDQAIREIAWEVMPDLAGRLHS
jgi:CheY-like chemotaxis protein